MSWTMNYILLWTVSLIVRQTIVKSVSNTKYRVSQNLRLQEIETMLKEAPVIEEWKITDTKINPCGVLNPYKKNHYLRIKHDIFFDMYITIQMKKLPSEHYHTVEFQKIVGQRRVKMFRCHCTKQDIPERPKNKGIMRKTHVCPTKNLRVHYLRHIRENICIDRMNDTLRKELKRRKQTHQIPAIRRIRRAPFSKSSNDTDDDDNYDNDHRYDSLSDVWARVQRDNLKVIYQPNVTQSIVTDTSTIDRNDMSGPHRILSNTDVSNSDIDTVYQPHNRELRRMSSNISNSDTEMIDQPDNQGLHPLSSGPYSSYSHTDTVDEVDFLRMQIVPSTPGSFQSEVTTDQQTDEALHRMPSLIESINSNTESIDRHHDRVLHRSGSSSIGSRISEHDTNDQLHNRGLDRMSSVADSIDTEAYTKYSLRAADSLKIYRAHQRQHQRPHAQTEPKPSPVTTVETPLNLDNNTDSDEDYMYPRETSEYNHLDGYESSDNDESTSFIHFSKGLAGDNSFFLYAQNQDPTKKTYQVIAHLVYEVLPS